MRIGIVSDTHKFTAAMDKAIPYLKYCDLIVHAGDNIDDPGKDEETFMAEDKKVLVCHGHNYGIKYSLDELQKRAEDKEADIVIFGHSHVPYYKEKDGIIFINPGSTSLPRGGSSRGIGILDVENGEITYERLKI